LKHYNMMFQDLTCALMACVTDKLVDLSPSTY
jgi:hypothetical protein